MALTSSAEHHVYDANPFQRLADGHLTGTVTFLSFSLDGILLAIGCEDGQLFVLEVEKWAVTRRWRFEDPDHPISAVWTQNNVLFFGTQAGDVHQLVFGSSPITDNHTHWLVGDPVLALACTRITDNRERLAFSSGDDVYFQDFDRFPSGEITRSRERKLPQPNAFPGIENDDDGLQPKLKAISVEFFKTSQHLIGTYKHHGIAIWDAEGRLLHRIVPHSLCIGRSALSQTGDRLYAANFCDGIDIYKLNKRSWSRSTFERTVEARNGENLSIPVVSIHDGTAILIGGTLGKVQALSLESEEVVISFSRTAPAPAKSVQAIAYTVVEGSRRTHYIAFGTSDGGANTAVHVYRGTDKALQKSKSRLTINTRPLRHCGDVVYAILCFLGECALLVLSFAAWIALLAVGVYSSYCLFCYAKQAGGAVLEWRAMRRNSTIHTHDPIA